MYFPSHSQHYGAPFSSALGHLHSVWPTSERPGISLGDYWENTDRKKYKKQLKVFKSTEDFTRFYPITDLLQLICTPRYGLCIYLRIPRTSSSYPKEKSRSASSIISNSSDCLRSRLPALMWANARVGVATMMSGFSINMGLSNKIHILILLVNK